jgi:hypothetical protein
MVPKKKEAATTPEAAAALVSEPVKAEEQGHNGKHPVKRQRKAKVPVVAPAAETDAAPVLSVAGTETPPAAPPAADPGPIV